MVPKYDAWLHWDVTDKCNLSCVYCFNRTSTKLRIAEMKNLGIKNIPSALTTKIKERFKTQYKKIDIDSLMKTLDRTNKIFKISFTGGGEPFSIPNLVDTCMELTKKHYIGINSNLTNKNIKEFSDIIGPERVIFIHGSLHIKELERVNLLDRYIYNFLSLRDKGFDIFAQEVAYPSLLGEVMKYRKFFKEKGIDITFGPFCGEYNGVIYPEGYTEQEIKIFGLKRSDMTQLFYHKGEICNAGYNVGIVSNKGDIRPCHLINKNIGNIYKEIKFIDKVIRCPFEFCHCPLNNFDPSLYNMALEKSKDKNREEEYEIGG